MGHCHDVLEHWVRSALVSWSLALHCTRAAPSHCIALLIKRTSLNRRHGDIIPHSNTGKVLTATAGVVARVTGTLLFALVIKKNQFSTMEARVHSFLYRMDLNAKKDLIAVMAVQATFRFNKSYRQSLIWHQQDQSYLYFRPLSAVRPFVLVSRRLAFALVYRVP